MASKQTLIRIIEPSMAALGYEVVDVDYLSGSEATLRVYIDGEHGISVDDCATASRHLGVVLDAEDPIAGHYMLEVSSPGIERPLVKPEHFARFVGEKVRVQLYTHLLGRRKFLGQMTEADESGIVVEVDGEPYEIEYDQIEKARLQPDL